MRFTWISNSPWTPSGYGQQTRIFVHRLASLGHEIGVICFHGLEGGVLNLGPNVTCFPKRFHPYGNDIQVPHSMAFGAQFIMSLMDVWVMEPESWPRNIPWVPWYPVDSDPLPELIRNKLNSSWMRITFSQYGVRKTHEAGLDCEYVPHGIETNVLKPKDKQEARKKLGIPADAWVIGSVAMNKGNPSRKNFAEMLTAFAECKKKHKDWFYWLQCDRGEGPGDWVNLPELCRNLGLEEGKDYAFCNQYQNIVGFPPDYFADLHSALDVHCLVSAGEGFGIPTLEAQACGTPVIVGDWTAHSELCLAGRMVSKSDAEPFYTGLATYQYKPHVKAVRDAMLQEWRKPTDTTQAVELIRAIYDADVVLEKHWKPVMQKIQDNLK